ncbi:hypothetical protein BDN72DRAFT_895261 [Pluteus cervinus]|uniref:Uncharacterized protein n=1 Tax=Pluteus cervinus TaxID=181527 RepID=A0ACD3B4H9_9AGAR|nr:hypothetical protein BDN72DRAFT_895261 [Pluteus cervinus]
MAKFKRPRPGVYFPFSSLCNYLFSSLSNPRSFLNRKMIYIVYLFMLALATLSFQARAAPLAQTQQLEARLPISPINLNGPGLEFIGGFTPDVTPRDFSTPFVEAGAKIAEVAKAAEGKSANRHRLQGL